MTVQAISLIPQDMPWQASLFVDTEKLGKLERLERCVDDIRRRFGKNSIRQGILLRGAYMPPEKAEITMPAGMIH